MNTLTVYGHITDPQNFNKFGTDEEPGIFATVVMNKYKGKDKQNKAITEAVFINFAAYGDKAKRLHNLKKGARILVELNPYNKVNNIEGKKITSVEYSCKSLNIIDWPDKG